MTRGDSQCRLEGAIRVGVRGSVLPCLSCVCEYFSMDIYHMILARTLSAGGGGVCCTALDGPVEENYGRGAHGHNERPVLLHCRPDLLPLTHARSIAPECPETQRVGYMGRDEW